MSKRKPDTPTPIRSSCVCADAWLTPTEVAARLKLPGGTDSIYALTRKNHPNPMPARRVGKYLRFKMSLVDAWAEGRAA